MSPLSVILIAHAAATIAMAGLVWFVQRVHYPLFQRVGRSAFPEYERSHSRLTSGVVVPLMLVEAAGAIALVVWLPERELVWWGVALLTLIWISTFGLQVPQHRRLEAGFDEAAYRRLVSTNWLRTAGWTARAAIALALLPGMI